MNYNSKLLPKQGDLSKDPAQYMLTAGKLNYKNNTRFTINVISQFILAPDSMLGYPTASDILGSYIR